MLLNNIFIWKYSFLSFKSHRGSKNFPSSGEGISLNDPRPPCMRTYGWFDFIHCMLDARPNVKYPWYLLCSQLTKRFWIVIQKDFITSYLRSSYLTSCRAHIELIPKKYEMINDSKSEK